MNAVISPRARQLLQETWARIARQGLEQQKAARAEAGNLERALQECRRRGITLDGSKFPTRSQGSSPPSGADDQARRTG